MIESKPPPKPPKNSPPEEKVEQAPPEETPTVIPEQAEQPPEKVEEPEAARPGDCTTRQGWRPAHRLVLGEQPGPAPAALQALSERSAVAERGGHRAVKLQHRPQRSRAGAPHRTQLRHADLDSEVMDMIMRAEPLPAFPANMPQAQLDLTVPIRFSMH